MAIPSWGVSPKHCVATGLRLIAARDLEAPDGRQPAFPPVFRRHSSPLREPAPRSLPHFQRANSEAPPFPLFTGSEAATACSEFVGSGKGSRHRERRENTRLPAHLARIFALESVKGLSKASRPFGEPFRNAPGGKGGDVQAAETGIPPCNLGIALPMQFE